MRVITCLMFPGGEHVVYDKKISDCIILMAGEYVRFSVPYKWKFRDMKMEFGTYKKRYIDRKE